MIKELVEQVLNFYYQEIGFGAGKMIRVWTPVENELAEYAAKLQAENTRLIAENKRLETAVKNGE